jgi:osmotically-inducible protein OsmY
MASPPKSARRSCTTTPPDSSDSVGAEALRLYPVIDALGYNEPVMNGRILFLWALIACAGAALPAGLHADDLELEKSVREALDRSGVEVAAVVVEAHDGVVVLKGTVKDARDKLELIQAAFGVSDVHEVQSQLGMRVGMTPDLEEAVWSELLKSGLDGNVTQVLVRDGVASIQGKAPDPAERDRVIEIVKSVPGIRSVENEIALPDGAETPPAPGTAEPRESAVPPNETPEASVAENPSEPTPPQQVAAPEASTEPIAGPAPKEGPEPKAVPEQPAAPAAAPEPSPAPEPTPVPETSSAAEPESTTRAPTSPQEPAASPEPPSPSTRPAQATPPAPTPQTQPPPSLAQEVAYNILSYSGYTVFDNIEFGVEGKDVFLRGTVTSPSKKRDLEERLKAIPGIGAVRSDIRILPESKADDQLRQRLFHRIYDDHLFAEHAKEPNPPIHILVEQGWVTLTGVVDELVEKMSAEALVRNVFEVVGVRNQIRIRDSMAPRR